MWESTEILVDENCNKSTGRGFWRRWWGVSSCCLAELASATEKANESAVLPLPVLSHALGPEAKDEQFELASWTVFGDAPEGLEDALSLPGEYQ